MWRSTRTPTTRARRSRGNIFFRNPNTRSGVFSVDAGRTLLIGDALAAAPGTGSAGCPTVAVTDHVPDPVALQRVFDDPNCFSFQEVFPGGFTPRMGGEALDASLAGGVRGLTAAGFNWDLSGAVGMHRSDLFIHETVNASLGPASPTAFDIGANIQREINLNADVSYAVTDRVNVAVGSEWRNEQFQAIEGDPASWTVRSLRPAGLLGRIQRVLRVRAAGRGHVGPLERRGLRRRRGDRHR